MKKEYRNYRFTKWEMVKYAGESLLAGGVLNYLFYQAWWAWLGVIPVMVCFFRWKKKSLITRQKKELNYQFQDALSAFSVALQAGYSVENAVRACRRDMFRLYGGEADIVRELQYMENQMSVSVPVEELLLDFGRRSGLEDIENFAVVFQTAKRTGGDMENIVRRTARMLGDKIDVKKEIEATLAAKKSEQTIMSLMPFAIIVYMQLTSPGFLSVLYGNAFGVAAMTGCLVIYFLACWMGRKIVDIQV